jgi:hypothetical protein
MGYSAVVRDLVWTMELMGFGGSARIAQTLARGHQAQQGTRSPLGAQFFTKEPTAQQMAALVLPPQSEVPQAFCFGSRFAVHFSIFQKHVGKPRNRASLWRYWPNPFVRQYREIFENSEGNVYAKARPPLAPDELYARLHA